MHMLQLKDKKGKERGGEGRIRWGTKKRVHFAQLGQKLKECLLGEARVELGEEVEKTW